MSFHRVGNWPPVWTKGTTRQNTQMIRGEVGILRYVQAYGQSSKKCYLVIEYTGEHYVGTLLFNDVKFRCQITELLRQHIGRSIKEIGDLEVEICYELFHRCDPSKRATVS